MGKMLTRQFFHFQKRIQKYLLLEAMLIILVISVVAGPLNGKDLVATISLAVKLVFKSVSSVFNNYHYLVLKSNPFFFLQEPQFLLLSRTLLIKIPKYSTRRTPIQTM